MHIDYYNNFNKKYYIKFIEVNSKNKLINLFLILGKYINIVIKYQKIP